MSCGCNIFLLLVLKFLALFGHVLTTALMLRALQSVIKERKEALIFCVVINEPEVFAVWLFWVEFIDELEDLFSPLFRVY